MEIDRKELKRRVREAMGQTIPKYWVVTLAYLAISIGISLVDRVISFFTTDPNTGFSFMGLFISILFTLFTLVIDFGYKLWSLWAYRRLNPGLGSLMQGFSVAGRVILLELMVTLRMLLWGMLLAVVLVLALVPLVLLLPTSEWGLILLMYIAVYAGMTAIQLRYAAAPYLLADHPDDGPGAAVVRSVALMRGHKWELFLLRLSFIGWWLLELLLSALAFMAALYCSGLHLAPLAADPTLVIQLYFYNLPFFLLSTLITLPLELWLKPYTSVADAGFYDSLRQIPQFDPTEMPPL